MHEIDICLSLSYYLPTKVTMSLATDELRVLHMHYVTLPQLHLAQLHLVKSSSYPFGRKIRETTLMEILHRIDQL
jgi:hypothetical protein